MSFIEFLPRPDLRAAEIQRPMRVELPSMFGTLLADEFGDAHLRSATTAHWYGDAVRCEQGAVWIAPVALTMDVDGFAWLTTPAEFHQEIISAIADLIAVPLVSTRPTFSIAA